MPRNPRSPAAAHTVDLSIVVPLFNEAGTVDELHHRLNAVLLLLGTNAEMVFIDDGSTDGTTEALEALALRDPRVRLVALARNYGQTAALAAGFDAAAGAVIVAMDGDLQHAPEEIPRLLAKLAEGYDVVSGWREQRVDNMWTRRLPSKIANWLMARLSGVTLHDFGTTFKAYRAPVIKSIRLYGDLHRFIPALASWGGARIAEVPIANIPRPQNQSHYGLSRTWRVMADLITVRFLLRYVTRPLHLFGPLGFGSVAIGALAGLWILATKVLTGAAVFLAHGPLLLLSAVLIQTGVMLIGLGLLAEVLTRIYMDGRHRRIYTVATRPRRATAYPVPASRPVLVRSNGAPQ
jgi:glycosyltransferase involved in cell wall biosynthesis